MSRRRKIIILAVAAGFIALVVLGYFRAASVQAAIGEYSAVIEQGGNNTSYGTPPCPGNCAGCTGCTAGITALEAPAEVLPVPVAAK